MGFVEIKQTEESKKYLESYNLNMNADKKEIEQKLNDIIKNSVILKENIKEITIEIEEKNKSLKIIQEVEEKQHQDTKQSKNIERNMEK